MTQNNYIDSQGLHLEDQATIVSDMISAMQGIYGTDINVEPNSPDRQMIELFAQAKADLLDTIAQCYNSFSPESASGTVLDQRCAINGVIRRGATYTRVPITIVTTSSVDLEGLDTNTINPFTIADDGGTRFFLETTQTLAAGTHTGIIFRAENIGTVSTTLNTITVIDTVTLGVSSVNNPSSNIANGIDEETDPQLRYRRRLSVSATSTGFLAGLIAALNALEGVSDAIVYENVGTTTDIYGVPAHSMWAIVDGGTDTDIANAIYNKRNAGCGMRGDVTVNISQVNGTLFPVKFDWAIPQDLWISATITSTDPTHVPDVDYLKAQIAEQISYTIYEVADFTEIISLLKSIDNYVVVTAGGVSDTNSSYDPYQYPSTIQHRWSVAAARILINLV